MTMDVLHDCSFLIFVSTRLVNAVIPSRAYGITFFSTWTARQE
jgi:hypothetical protein